MSNAVANLQRVAFVPVSEMDKANWVSEEKTCLICWEDLVPAGVNGRDANGISKIVKNLTYWVNPLAKRAKDMTPMGHILVTKKGGNWERITHSDNTTPKIGHAVHRECAVKAKGANLFKKCFTCQNTISNIEVFEQTTSLKERMENLLGYVVLGALAAGSIAYVARRSPDQVAIAAIAGYAFSLIILTMSSSLQEKFTQNVCKLSVKSLEKAAIRMGVPERQVRQRLEQLQVFGMSPYQMIELVDGFMDFAYATYPFVATNIGCIVGSAFIERSNPELLEMGTKVAMAASSIAICIMLVSLSAKVSVLVDQLMKRSERAHNN